MTTRYRFAQRPGTPPRYSLRRLALVGVLLLVVPLLSACADNSDDRSFANDPKTMTVHPTEESPTVGTTAIAPVLPSPELLVNRRGAPAVVYAWVDGALRSFDGKAANVVVDGEVVAFASSPSGDRVAVLTAATSDTADTVYSIVIHTPDGEVTRQFDDVLTAPADLATPEMGTEATGAVAGLSWAAQGGRLLLVHSAGRLVDIPLDGVPQEINPAAPIVGAFEAAWSPRGDAIGLLRRNDEGRGEVMMIDTTAKPARVTVVAPTDERQSVERFEWMVNGRGVLYLKVTRTDQGLTGGTIVEWNRADNSTTIVATGGQAGPAGSVTWFSVSPDGKALVYRVATPTETGWSFNGLFVRSMRNGQVYRVPVPGNVAVTGAWWYAGGLLRSQIVTIDGEDSTAEFVLTDATGAQTRLAVFPLAGAVSPGASPVSGTATPVRAQASPVASPVPSTAGSPAASLEPKLGVSPVASPVATPAASPVASPVASPAASSLASPVASPVASPPASIAMP